MSYCCPVRSILIVSLFACGVLSFPAEKEKKNRTNAVNSEVSDIADFDQILKNIIYSTTDNTSKVFLKFAYKQLERSRQKRMPPESYSPEQTNQSSSEILDMNTSFVHPTDDDDKIESEPPRLKDLVPPALNSMCNETDPKNASLPPMTFPERPSCPENVILTITDVPKDIQEKFKPRKRKKYFPSTTGTPQLDEENPSSTTATTEKGNETSADTAKETSNAQGTSNNRNALSNVNRSTEQLNTESSDVSSSTTDSTTESTEIIKVMPIESSTTERTEDDDTDESKNSITKAKMEENEAKETGMPSGVIALVTAITFATAVVIAYVGLIVWRRYLEYRYGNRELLVNDLEFDTNDLRHFEL